MSAVDISVILCTHNPRTVYLARTLESLHQQTLPTARWELLLVDNASDKPLSGQWNLPWHPNGRHLREDALGLTHARLCGIRHARSDLLVFVDDDNVLDPAYLQGAWKIGQEKPFLGAWGGARVPEFEHEPEAWQRDWLWLLALGEVERDEWSNYLTGNKSLPVGAGMCVRRVIAEAYARLLADGGIRREFDRRGTSLASCGDLDFALTACDIGYGTGMFRRLQLVHLIPATRLTMAYMERMVEEAHFSFALLDRVRGIPVARRTGRRRLIDWIKGLATSPSQRRLQRAQWRGTARGERLPLAGGRQG